MELIPACVPESVGFEIENILHSSFGHSKPTYNLETDFRNKNKKPGIKKPSPQKKKSPRTLSTEDLHPNLLINILVTILQMRMTMRRKMIIFKRKLLRKEN